MKMAMLEVFVISIKQTLFLEKQKNQKDTIKKLLLKYLFMGTSKNHT